MPEEIHTASEEVLMMKHLCIYIIYASLIYNVCVILGGHRVSCTWGGKGVYRGETKCISYCYILHLHTAPSSSRLTGAAITWHLAGH